MGDNSSNEWATSVCVKLVSKVEILLYVTILQANYVFAVESYTWLWNILSIQHL